VYHRFRVDFLRSVAGALARADARYVLAAVVLHLAGLLATGQRWRIVVAAFGRRLSLTRATLINLAGVFVRNATPTTGLGGDASRIALLRVEGLTLPQGTATFLYVRAAELPAMGALAALALPVLGEAIGGSGRGVAAASIAGSLAVAVAWTARRRLRARVAEWRARTSHLQIGWATLAAAIAYASLAQAETVVRQIVAARAFGLPLTLQQSATITALSIAGGLVPTIGSVGAVEGSLVAGLIMCGAPADTAVAITLVERAISYGLSTLLGAGALAALGGRAVLQLAAARTGDAVTAG
jgi:glycosyltransferase 2 family protein